MSDPIDAGTGFAVRPATVADREAVLAVLDARSAWLHERGVHTQWPMPFPRPVIDADLAARRLQVVEDTGRVVATFALTDTDPLWGDDERPDAAYLHRFATQPGRAGLGGAMLARITADAAARGRRVLRLDCVADNPALNAYYRHAGFTPAGTRTVHATQGDGWPKGSSATVALFELDLTDGITPGSGSARPSPR